MRVKSFFIFIIVLILLIPAQAQDSKEAFVADTIHLLSTRKLAVKIKSVYSSSVSYEDLKTGESKTVDRKQIQKLVYGNGRVEVFNKPVFSMVAEGDWKTVITTEKESDVEGLIPITDVSAISPKSAKDFKQAKRNAEIRLRKEGAKYGGMIVLITHKENSGGFGDVPTYYVEGMVYGYEEPSPEMKLKIEADKKEQAAKVLKEEAAKEKKKAAKKKKKKRR